MRIIKSSRNNAAKSGFHLYVCDREGWSLLMPVTTSAELRVLTSRLGFWHLNMYDMDSPEQFPPQTPFLLPVLNPNSHHLARCHNHVPKTQVLRVTCTSWLALLSPVLLSRRTKPNPQQCFVECDPSSSPLLLRGLTMNNLRLEEAHTLMTAQDITYACVHSQLRLCIVPLYQANVRRKKNK